jgi:hypothetical protein
LWERKGKNPRRSRAPSLKRKESKKPSRAKLFHIPKGVIAFKKFKKMTLSH